MKTINSQIQGDSTATNKTQDENAHIIKLLKTSDKMKILK
jgi:hypothetical protein